MIATTLVLIGSALVLIGVLGYLSGRKERVQTPSTTTGESEPGGEGMMNTLKAKAQGVTQHFTLLKGLAALGLFVLVMSSFNWATTSKAPPTESGPHTLTGLCQGETYGTLFLPLFGQKQEILLRKGYTFKDLDIRVLYPLGGDGVAEYRYDGKNLIEKDGNKTEYSISSPPPGTNGFFLKIGRGNKTFQIPPGTIKVDNAPEKPKRKA